jgi:outer membrane protein TolC
MERVIRPKERSNEAASFTRGILLGIGMMIALTIPNSQGLAQATAPAGTTESQVQPLHPPGPGQSAAPITVTLQDALERARKNDSGYRSALSDAKSAHEDRLQARNALLPTVEASLQYLGTQGNGGRISDGRFVTNDGIHVYRAWGVFHQDLSPGTFMATGLKKAAAAEALAKAKAEIARRGLTVAVSKNYHALVVAQRKYAIAQWAVDQAKQLWESLRAGGEPPKPEHSVEPKSEPAQKDQENPDHGAAGKEEAKAPNPNDVLRAEVAYRKFREALDEARLGIADARLDLAVMLFPTLNENFSVVDDLDSVPALPPFSEIQSMAEKENPDLRVAIETLRQSDLDVRAAKTAFFPTLTVDTDYGIEANCFALRCPRAAFPEIGSVPNLGYFLTTAMTIPVWDWGTLRSKLHQAQYKQQTAKVQLSQTQRLLVSELYAAYNEAAFARSALEESRHAPELAAEILRLTREGESPEIFQIIEDRNQVVEARYAYIEAHAHYRSLLANLQTITGSF